MARRTPNPFVAITSAGGLLPIPLLERLAIEPDTVAGTDPADYELLPGKRLREIINRSWNDLLGTWAAFRTHRDRLAPDDPAVALTRDRWLLPLLRELGWAGLEVANGSGTLFVDEPGHTDGTREWPISHEWKGRVPLHLLGWNVDLDRRTPDVRGAATAAPHSILQDYLNASDAHLWGLVANGRRLRVLRDSTSLTRQAHLELDLETIFDNEVFADFVVLWMVAHRTRLDADLPDDCWLERWQHAAHEQGVRALDQLRDGVTRAIEALGTGLLAHPANQTLRTALRDGDLGQTDLYRQLLRIIYRLVFLFVVEDRDLLHPPGTEPQHRERYVQHYSTARLRDQARRHRGGHHPDGWEQLTVLFTGLAQPGGIRALGLPSLAGGLFDPAWSSALTGTRMANRDLYTAIRALAFTQQADALHRIDYRNLGAEELGSVYESLLELHPAVDLAARTFELGVAAGNERKTTGAYYTPDSLITQILDDALDPVLDEATARKTGPDAEVAILNLTVCDPACGSAHFLTAAAHRIAKRLAAARTGDPEPAPLAIQQAMRDVIGRCIYGVDVNPTAVELAKVSLWLECHVPGQPLTFLDHHIRCGNSLLGVHHPDLIAWHPERPTDERGGIPDGAFTGLPGDDKTIVTAASRANKNLRNAKTSARVLSFTDSTDIPATVARLAERAGALAHMADATLDALDAKRAAWDALDTDPELRRLRLAADAWCATFTMPKTAKALRERVQQPWDAYYALQSGQDLPDDNQGITTAHTQAEHHRFFHWFVEFADVHAAGGFDVMVGNPPWEVLQMSEEEWFASRAPDIADASNAAARKRLITALAEAPDGSPDRDLANAWKAANHDQQAIRHLISRSGRYPYSAVGKLNIFAMFVELACAEIGSHGRVGMVIPDKLAVGKTYSDFFSHLVKTRRLATFYSFENEDKVFPAVHNETKFALVTITGTERPVERIAFTGYVRQAAQIHDPGRRYDLSPSEIAAINPNTLTAPLFRHARDAEVTATLHRNAPVLIRAGEPAGNPWGIAFLQMFNMASDSGLFITAGEARDKGGRLEGAAFLLPEGAVLLPLYEGKMVWHYDHRYGTYEGQTQKQANKGVLPHVTDEQHADPDFAILHRYWLPKDLVDDSLAARWNRSWMIAFRDVGPSERTMVCAVIPRTAAGHKTPLVLTTAGPLHAAYLYAQLASFPCDYALRQKTAGGMSLFVVEQAPVLPPPSSDEPSPWGNGLLLAFVVPRVVELSYTARDLAGFAADCGMAGQPFRWEPDRRALVQAELDALFFHQYGLDRDDTEWMLDTFTVLRKYEEKPPSKGGQGEFRTKRLVLERYDAMAAAIATGAPYRTPVDPPPGDDRARTQAEVDH